MTIKTRKDSEFWFTLEDGTIVHMNYNSKLVYPVHFGKHERTVYLDGEAYFQVSKEKQRPFRVLTKDGVVTEYGTTFNVNTQALECTKVVLLEGSVSIKNRGQEEVFIKPGQLGIINQQSENIEVFNVDVQSYVAWNNGRFMFDNYSLEQIMKVISQWYGIKVVFSSEDLKRYRFTGDMDKYGSVQPILNAISSVANVSIERNGQNIVINK